MKRPIAGESIARFVYEPEEIDPYIDALIAENDRLREAIKAHRRNVWGKYGEVNHPEDVELYVALAEGGRDE
jgi:hypothetical protein